MMRDNPTVGLLIGESRQVHATLAVYYDGESVFDTLPIIEGDLEIDSTNAVPGALSVSVPRFTTDEYGRTIDVAPFTPGPSVNAEGTQVAVDYHVSIPGKPTETISLGWYRIAEWEESGDGVIELTAESLEALIAEARFINPLNTGANETYVSAATRLVGNLLPLSITADPTPKTGKQTFEDDRLDALNQLVTAWPARMRVDDSGTLAISPPYDDATDPVVVDLTDGERGTVVNRPTSGSRDGVYNAVKASGEAGSGTTAPVSAVAYLREGPRRWNGPYGNVPYFYSSPLLTTKTQAQRAANTRLTNLQVKADPITAEIAPDPRIEIGDVATLTYHGTTEFVRITGIGLPLTYDGAMTITGYVINRNGGQ